MGGGEPSGDGGTLCDLCELDGPGGGYGSLVRRFFFDGLIDRRVRHFFCDGLFDGRIDGRVRRFFFDGLFDGLIDRRVRCFFSDGLIDGQGPGRALAAGLVSNLLTSSSPKIASNGNC